MRGSPSTGSRACISKKCRLGARRSLCGFVTIAAKHRPPLGRLEGDSCFFAALRTGGKSFNLISTAIVGLRAHVVGRSQRSHMFRFARFTAFGGAAEILLL